MVKMTLLAALVAVQAGASAAQAVDWSRAGGDLFGRDPEPPILVGLQKADGEPVRPDPLDQPFMAAIDAAARRHGLDPKLLHALVIVESGYDTTVCSPAGACGLTQLMPGTAVELGVRDRLNPLENLEGGADYLARQMREFGDVRLAFAAYNSGPGRVRRQGRIPNIEETQTYVVRIVDCYLALTAGRTPLSARQCQSPGAGR